MNGFPQWILYGLQPGPISPSFYSSNDVAALTKTDDSGCWLWNIENDDYVFLETLRLMAHVSKESDDITRAQWITWLINERFQDPEHTSTFDILFNDRTTPPKSASELNLPTCKAFGWDDTRGLIDSYMDNPKAGLGQVYMKSSWDQGSSTTHALFKAFPYYYFGHQHFDSLSFSIFKGEPLALQNSGMYYYHYEGGDIDKSSSVGFPHHWYYYERPVSANTLLVMDPNEEVTYTGHSHVHKDGGQRKLYDGSSKWGDNTEGTIRDWGGLIRHEDTPHYTYSSGDATKGYNSIVDGVHYLSPNASAKVTLVQRDSIYLK